ncbi:hypothetical protein [Pseudoalteromonas denitrificans]|uniref:Immunity protein 42 n=1 Tax=Pseudoalteromonas denitrificans DSM 6059 TaxID=1123010 RepID=A0A1I1T501_9GAMM|nr:hypothetical protein [Pseudoalteromonas denitrificans]SFD53706.1 hypothetical protein SAMN02745724_04789 [Pseudoalteromonas denitrificans DSM 6059]
MKVINLRLEIGCISFILRKFHDDTYFWDFDIECLMEKKFECFNPKHYFCSLNKTDLINLVEYFQTHYLGLIDNQLTESQIFMPLEGDFQIKCMEGEIDNIDDGYFSISLMFNNGKPYEDASNCYFGFESVVDIQNIILFCQDIKTLLKLSS